MVLGLMMSSERSTLVRCWPSVAAFWIEVSTERVARRSMWNVMGWDQALLHEAQHEVRMGILTVLALANFFSVPIIAPER